MTHQQNLFFYLLFGINIVLFFFFLLTKSYPLFAVGFCIVSVLILWFWVFKSFHIQKNKIVWDVVVMICLFLLALGTYLYNIDVVTPGIEGDEVMFAQVSERIITSGNIVPFVPDGFGHPTPLFYLMGWSIKFFGRTIFAIRLPAVLFAVFSIVAFYVLLRLFFTKTISVTGSLLMLFSYPFIINARLATEIPMQIFFQIVSVIFLTLVWKRKEVQYYVAIGLSLGAGLYTYVGFRTFAVIVLFVTMYFIYQNTKSIKNRLTFFFVTIAAFFITLVPLLSYGITNSQSIMSRTSSLSPFNQGFSTTEVTNELFANVGRLPRLFFMGDPNVGPNGDNNFLHNPSNVSMFDSGTFLFFVIGLFFFLRTNRKLFLIIALLSLSPLINDIFVIERFPELLHPYGVGHPHTFRIAGIIPIVYFIIVYGVDKIGELLKKSEMNFSFVIFFLLAISMFYNWYLYYEQPLDKNYSFYIDNYDGVYALDVVELINKSGLSHIAVSPQIMSDERFMYFLKKGVMVKAYNPKNYNEAIKEAENNQVSIFYALSNTNLAQQLLTQEPEGLQIKPLSLLGTSNTIYAVALIKNSF